MPSLGRCNICRNPSSDNSLRRLLSLLGEDRMRRSAWLLGTTLAVLPLVAKADDRCSGDRNPELRQRIERAVAGLRIAQYRADMGLLERNFDELEELVGADN